VYRSLRSLLPSFRCLHVATVLWGHGFEKARGLGFCDAFGFHIFCVGAHERLSNRRVSATLNAVNTTLAESKLVVVDGLSETVYGLDCLGGEGGERVAADFDVPHGDGNVGVTHQFRHDLDGHPSGAHESAERVS